MRCPPLRRRKRGQGDASLVEKAVPAWEIQKDPSTGSWKYPSGTQNKIQGDIESGISSPDVLSLFLTIRIKSWYSPPEAWYWREQKRQLVIPLKLLQI